MRRLVPAALLLMLLALGPVAKAVEPRERLADPALEARARALSQEVRCLVCQNESIDDSDADLAHDLRVLLRERIAAGDSDGQALRFLVSRYGDFVLLKPPVEPETCALWFGPPAILALGAVGAAFYLRRHQAEAPPRAQFDRAVYRDQLKELRRLGFADPLRLERLPAGTGSRCSDENRKSAKPADGQQI